jgi:hypothetical protein
MKNLLIYINPSKCFSDEGKVTIKIQIDNSLDLGWKREDIMLVTNFPYEYNGIKSLVVEDDNYCSFEPLSSKTWTISNLFEKKLIKEGELYWAHDLDAFQNEVITKAELESEITDMGITDRGRVSKWSMGSIFFKSSSKDIFNWIKDIMYKYKIDEESAVWILTGHDNFLHDMIPPLVKGYTESDIPGIKNINERVKKINISYNFRMWNIDSTVRIVVKPIRVIHFHPFQERSELDFFMYGKNRINMVLMPERLIKIFNKHGIK